MPGMLSIRKFPREWARQKSLSENDKVLKEPKLGDRMLRKHSSNIPRAVYVAQDPQSSLDCRGNAASWTFDQAYWSIKWIDHITGILKPPKYPNYSMISKQASRPSYATDFTLKVRFLYITPYQSAKREDPNYLLVYIQGKSQFYRETFYPNSSVHKSLQSYSV